MISIDVYILEFIGRNWLTIGLVFIFLNGLCEIIPGTWDDKFVAVLKRMITFARQGTNNQRKIEKQSKEDL